jgi:outer membrane protein TolC
MKNYLFKLKLLFLFGCLFDQYSNGQQMSLNQFLEHLEKENLELKISDQQVENAQNDLNIAKSGLLPSITAGANYQRDLNKNYLFINDENGFTQKLRTNFNNSIGATVSLDQTVFNPMIFSAVKIVKLNKEVSEINHQATKNQLKTNASVLYWQVLFAKQSVEVLYENTELAEFQFNQSQTLFKKGVISELELYQTEVQYQKAVSAYQKNKTDYQKLLNELKTLINIPLDTKLELSDALNNIELSSNQDRPFSVDKNLSLLSLQKQKEVALQETKGREKYWLPKLNLRVNYDYNAQANNFKFGANKNNFFNAQLGLNFPIYSGGKHRAELSKAKINQEVADLNLLQTKNKLAKELANHQNDKKLALEHIKLHQKTVKLTEKELNIYKKQINLGVISPLEFKESRLRFIQSKLDVLNAFLDLRISELRIKEVMN